jgi:choloylglycine hydrolase
MLKKDFLADGMNEKGLAVGMFYHPGFASYPSYEKEMAVNSITAADVTTFILTQFATIEEICEGMSRVRVVPVVEEAPGKQVDSHWMVTKS